jgi:hypothetical protein
MYREKSGNPAIYNFLAMLLSLKRNKYLLPSLIKKCLFYSRFFCWSRFPRFKWAQVSVMKTLKSWKRICLPFFVSLASNCLALCPHGRRKVFDLICKFLLLSKTVHERTQFCAASVRIRVTRLGENRPMSDCLLWAVSWKSRKCPAFFGYFIRLLSLRINFEKNGLCCNLGEFFANSSGHPVQNTVDIKNFCPVYNDWKSGSRSFMLW